MKVYVQWARSAPGGWSEVDHPAWDGQDHRPADGALDNRPGLVAALNVQGVTYSGEHWDRMAVRPGDDDGVVVYAWNADTAVRHIFRELAPDPAIGNALNTRQHVHWYTDDAVERVRIARRVDCTLHAHADFTMPPAASRFDCRGDNAAGHDAVRSPKSWRQWSP